MKKIKFLFQFYLLFLPLYLFSQTHFTVPANVWRVSVKPIVKTGSYIGPGGVKGVPNMPFSLSNYGTRFFDHTNIVNGFYASETDAHNLDTLTYNSTYTIGQYIQYYNALYGDSIPNMSADFFGNDSISINGDVDINDIKRTSWGMNFSIEYGISDKVTFHLKIPYYTYVSRTRSHSWNVNEIEGLESFIAYHENTRSLMDSALVNNFDSDLQNIRDRFYSWGGANSLLWAMEGQPGVAGFYGAEFNPFTQNDSISITMKQLMDYYYPSSQTASGLGDVELGLNVLLFGDPAWSEKGNASLYLGISALFASASRINTYRFSSGIDYNQSHFTSLPLGDGVSKYSISVFGELYRNILNRNINITWKVKAGINYASRLNTPISFVDQNTFDPDTIASAIGTKYNIEKGNDIFAMAQGKMELIPDWISVSGGVSFYLKGRDTFYSNDLKWNDWMQYREDNYDTRVTAIRQFAEVALHNIHPLKRIGPIPFEVRGGYSIPVFTRNTFSDISAWIQLVVYAQAW